MPDAPDVEQHFLLFLILDKHRFLALADDIEAERRRAAAMAAFFPLGDAAVGGALKDALTIVGLDNSAFVKIELDSPAQDGLVIDSGAKNLNFYDIGSSQCGRFSINSKMSIPALGNPTTVIENSKING